jgi:hypothetical protein
MAAWRRCRRASMVTSGRNCRFVLAQYHQGQMTVPRLVALLRSLGILIYKGQVLRLLIVALF